MATSSRGQLVPPAKIGDRRVGALVRIPFAISAFLPQSYCSPVFSIALTEYVYQITYPQLVILSMTLAEFSSLQPYQRIFFMFECKLSASVNIVCLYVKVARIMYGVCMT